MNIPNPTHYIVRRHYTIHDRKECDFYLYITSPINAIGCESEISDIKQAYRFLITSDNSTEFTHMNYFWNEYYENKEYEGADSTGINYKYKQEKIAI